MKKIIITIIAVFTLIISIKGVHAYETGSNVLTNNTYTIEYSSKYLASSTNPMLEIAISFNGDAIGYDTLIINGIYNIGYIYDTSTRHSSIGQGYSSESDNNDWETYYFNVSQPILRPANVVKTLNEPIKANTTVKLYYYYNTSGDGFNQAVSAIKSTVSIILITGGGGYSDGYRQALQDSELYYDNLIEQIIQNKDYDLSIQYDLVRNEFGIYYNGQWYNAQDWGDLRFQEGINANPADNPLEVMFGGLASLLGVGFAFILQLGSIELLGISLNMILGIGLLLVGILAILGLIFGGK